MNKKSNGCSLYFCNFYKFKIFPNKELAGVVFKLKLKTLGCEENFYLPSSYTCVKHFPSSGELINIF